MRIAHKAVGGNELLSKRLPRCFTLGPRASAEASVAYRRGLGHRRIVACPPLMGARPKAPQTPSRMITVGVDGSVSREIRSVRSVR